MRTVKRPVIALCILILLSAACMWAANLFQTDFGRVEVTEGVLTSEAGPLAWKLYRPRTATPENPAPAVLLLHGYQNDRETCAAYAIELSRRGYVVLSLDEYGHGETVPGLINRGYTNHKVTVNYGNDSEEDGTYVAIGGPDRYKVMMNFSNLSFFRDRYSRDGDGNAILDSSAGGIAGYAYLASLPFVRSDSLGISGHSMGTWSGWSVAAAYAGTPIEPRALVLQCGELFRDSVYDTDAIRFNNVLLLQAKYDEFSYFRDYADTVSDALLATPLRQEFLGCPGEAAAWNTLFGDFADGSARRMELLRTNHRLTTHNAHGLSTALAWFDSAVSHTSGIPCDSQTAMIKEFLVLAAMLLTLCAMFPLMNILLALPLFSGIPQELPGIETVKKPSAWWFGALLSILLSAASFPFMTQLGHGLLPLPENIFRMTVGNGFLSWYLTLILIMLATSLISRIRLKKKGLTYSFREQGLSVADRPGRPSAGLFFRCLLLAAAMCGLVYLCNLAWDRLFHLDLRFIWPFFRPFCAARAGQFGVYIPVFMLFYILNNAKIIAGLRTRAAYREGFGAAFAEWLAAFFIMAGGLLTVTLIEYIPFFLEMGPGADLLFGTTFGGPFMSLLILFVPQVLFFSVLCTVCYRRTHSVYTGALTTAILACWIVTGGSAML